MKRVIQTNEYYRSFCLIAALLLAAVIIYFSIRGDLGSWLSLLFPVILSLVFLHQALFIESFTIESDRFVYLNEFLLMKFNRAEIPFVSILSLERIQNVQLRTRFIINYYDAAAQLSQFSLVTSTLFPYRFINPDLDKVFHELSLACGKEIIRKFE
jgi:hypothetical protein